MDSVGDDEDETASEVIDSGPGWVKYKVAGWYCHGRKELGHAWPNPSADNGNPDRGMACLPRTRP